MTKGRVGVLLLVLMLLPRMAAAGLITLGSSNFGGNPAGPFADIFYTLGGGGTTATFTFTGLENNGNQYLFGGQGAVALNLTADVTLVGPVTGTQPLGYGGQGVGPFSVSLNQQEDGFGNFAFTLDNFDGTQRAANAVSFTVQRTSGTWANEASILSLNALGWSAAAHIFVCDLPCTQAGGAILTGYAGGVTGTNPPPPPPPPPPQPVPEPASMLMLGSGLSVLAVRLRKKYGK